MARRDYEESGKFTSASAKTIEGVYGITHPDYLVDATDFTERRYCAKFHDLKGINSASLHNPLYLF